MTVFKRVAIKTFLAANDERVHQLKTLLGKHGVDVVEEEQASDLIISVGGDGTLLHHAKLAHKYQIPILGVNAGRVGFLADLEYGNDAIVKSIIDGHYIQDSRIVLTCEYEDYRSIIVNELMVSKLKATQAIRYEVFIDDRFMYEQMGDGLIVATPTGSTAYALSAGGQILHPNLEAVSLVPVCSQFLSARAVTIPADSEVRINVMPWKGSVSIMAIDAQEQSRSESMKGIVIRKHEKPLTLIHPRHYDYYQTLQSKLNWETTI